jgi:hypothetical protein
MTVRGALAVIVFAAVSLQAQVTFDRLLHTDREPQNWLTYSGNVLGQRYSPLAQITAGNVKNLELQWVWQAKSLEKYETTALVVDGVLYTIQAPNNTANTDGNTQVVARRGHRPPVLDVSLRHPVYRARLLRPCESRTGHTGDTLYMATLNSHLIAISAKNGTYGLGHDGHHHAGLPDGPTLRWWSATRSSSEPRARRPDRLPCRLHAKTEEVWRLPHSRSRRARQRNMVG